jgi:hypothetical protein
MRATRHSILICLLSIACGLWAPQAARCEDSSAAPQLDAAILDALLQSGAVDRCGAVDDGAPNAMRAPAMDKAQEPTVQATITIPVAFHVISTEVLKNGVLTRVGDVSMTRLDAQIQVLNKAFLPAGIQFTKLRVDRVLNPSWFTMTMGSTAEAVCKRSIAFDPAHTLNIYTCGIPNGQIGWAYYPWAFAESSYLQGLVVHYGTLPGGSVSHYNQGDTATHELGHYFGLYHTFEGGCGYPGDYVTDTPAEATPAFGKPLNRDTCPTLGTDPIHNYMDYVDDSWMYEFTPGQLVRMNWALRAYRSSLTAPSLLFAEPATGGAAGGKSGTYLDGASPNPFNPTTSIRFTLDHETHVTLRIYDVAGHEMAQLLDGVRPAGEHRVVFEGRGLASGVYMALLRTDRGTARERLILTK